MGRLIGKALVGAAKAVGKAAVQAGKAGYQAGKKLVAKIKDKFSKTKKPNEPCEGCPKAKQLTPQQQKSVKSLQERLAEHEKKLAEYKADPDKFDNKGMLKNAPNQAVRESIIKGRIKHLQNEIDNFNKQIKDIQGGGP